jgi:hypothetical protein
VNTALNILAITLPWVICFALIVRTRDLKRALQHANDYGVHKATDLHRTAVERDALHAQLAGIKAIIDPPPPEAG